MVHLTSTPQHLIGKSFLEMKFPIRYNDLLENIITDYPSLKGLKLFLAVDNRLCRDNQLIMPGQHVVLFSLNSGG